MLHFYFKSKNSVVLVCQAPESHQGVAFRLYRHREMVILLRMCGCFLEFARHKYLLARVISFFLYVFSFIEVDSQELQTSVEEVGFTININEKYSGQDKLFCCMYKDQKGCYSAFSPYLMLENQIGLWLFFFSFSEIQKYYVLC